MATQLIFDLTVFLVNYAGSAFLLIEILMWAMGRLDDPKASSRSRISAVKYQFASALSAQAYLAHAYRPQGYVRNSIEASQFGHPQTSTPLFQLTEESEELPPNVPFNVRAAAGDTWMPGVGFDHGTECQLGLTD